MPQSNTLLNDKDNVIYFDFTSIQDDKFLIAKRINAYKQKPIQFLAKQFIEKTGTFIGLIMLLPFFLLIAIMIKLDTKGPVLFKQERLGRFGKKFCMYKFRSMHTSAEKQKSQLNKYNQTNPLMFKMMDDPRVTRVGKFLRKYSLDEFPQLINVLKGEMSLVGFRPPLPEEVNNYNIRHYVRFAATPGLTGPWQTGGRSKIKNFDEVINLEYNYIKTWNIFKDAIILLKTIPIVVFGDKFS